MNKDLYRIIFEEERRKLNLPNIELIFLEPLPKNYYYHSFGHFRIVHDRNSTRAIKNHDWTYTVQFNPLSYRNEVAFRKNARHELYHISKDHSSPSLLKYLFYYEPSAMLYATTGLKI